jgi:isopenicillin-N N-acyltransferase like protein
VTRRRKLLIALVALAAAPLAAHAVIAAATTIAPPHVTVPPKGAGYTLMRAGVREVYVAGSPEQIGADVTRLLRERMVVDEADLWQSFGTFVPLAPVRAVIMDVARVRYRHVDRGIPEARRRELAAQALALSPDPFDGALPTYQRMVFLHSLYDIALGFEEAPLVGCTAMAFGPGTTRDGHAIVARAFDFEASEDHDKDKAVYFVREDGAIPFASVAWPGLIGVMTGMNLEGVMVFVNGARAKAPIADGEPVVFSLREVLERAHDTREAVALLEAQRPMVSHLVFVADAAGRFAVVERAPGTPAFVRDAWPDPDRVALTNHFEGPLADDPRNQRVRARTTTLARRARADELVAAARDVDAPRAVGMMRDHACAGGEACALGDRRALDALIATHGVVADTTARVMWVSAGPHLSGNFVKFDLNDVFAPGRDPTRAAPPEIIAEDPVLFDGRYEAGRARAGGPRVGGDRP